ncbi:uncharacterized protein LOC131245122 [Magnolia sinica]|uniref:uncharacterized protein LOC131245122 n=1 Tax=Magnolia sinica TaxID=86752 RepID=UPI002657D414|nr:uncharacterized protein LOC131245122 [Magnolia sinica]
MHGPSRVSQPQGTRVRSTLRQNPDRAQASWIPISIFAAGEIVPSRRPKSHKKPSYVRMTKRRGRRLAAEPGQDRAEPAAPVARTSDAATHTRISYFFFFLFLLIPIVSIAVYRLKYPPTHTHTVLSVLERGLVKPNIGFQEIIAENSKASENTSFRHFPHPVLAYVTPWNSKGYEMSKRFTPKITHLSPVWYNLKSDGSQLLLEGRHNADTGWISELRRNGNSLVLPRVVLEALPNQLLRKKKQWKKAIDLITTECKEIGYDGIVLESWSRWAGYGVLHDPDMRSMALQFIKQLGQDLHSVRSERNSNLPLQLVFVIAPPSSENLEKHDFGLEDFQSLRDDVDGFSLMTYDFSGPQRPGPNAPLNWIRSSLQLILGNTDDGARNHALKIFLGINFYGNDFVLSGGSGGGAITGKEYLSLLKKHKPVLQWKEDIAEHFFLYSEDHIRHAVFYPSLLSIYMRLAEARKWGVSLSIWEIGQGLDYFFDLL